MFSDYELGVLYGDGYFQNGKFFFTTTHKELYDYILFRLHQLKIDHLAYTREYQQEMYENWSELFIIEIKDLLPLEHLSHSSDFLFKKGADFIRGYIETKSSLFSYKNRNRDVWRLSVSGAKDDLKSLLNFFEFKLSMPCKKIFQRQDRKELGVISKSYRVNFDQRMQIFSIISFIYHEKEVSFYLKAKMNEFLSFHQQQSFNKNKIFKNYKYATQAMARTLDIKLNGIRGGGGARGYKPIYLWEGERRVKEFKGWLEAYYFIKILYEETTGFTAPIVKIKK